MTALKEIDCGDDEQIGKKCFAKAPTASWRLLVSHFPVQLTVSGNCVSFMNYKNCLKLLMASTATSSILCFSSNFVVYLFFHHSFWAQCHHITSNHIESYWDSTRCQLFLWTVYGACKLWWLRLVVMIVRIRCNGCWKSRLQLGWDEIMLAIAIQAMFMGPSQNV